MRISAVGLYSSIDHFIDAEPSRRVSELLALCAPTDTAPSETSAFPQITGFEVIGRLGHGGMGIVWRARQLSTRREVALKLLRASYIGDEQAHLRFQREVELTARLEHPHIARVYASGVEDGLCYYAMELIHGVPLDTFVKDQCPSQVRALQILATVCQAVQHAHQRGVIHRDLKPSNVLVDADGQPHVLDFGLAKDFSEGPGDFAISRGTHVPGTLAFMSPEQAAGHAVDTRSDVYSLGMILYQMLLGSPPHDLSGSYLEVMRRIAEEEVIPPRGVDHELRTLLLKALRREPAERYASAGDLAIDIDNYLLGEPLRARPPTLAYFASKRIRRHRLAVALGASAAAATLVSLVFSFVRIRQERNQAIAARIFADSQSRLALRNERIAGEARHLAEVQRLAAETNLGDSLNAQADAMAQANRWVEAKRLYSLGGDLCRKLGRSALVSDSGLTISYAQAPPPLLTFRDQLREVSATTFFPSGTLAAEGDVSGGIRLWDLKNGRIIGRFTGHSAPVLILAGSGDGKRMLSGSADGSAILWDIVSQKAIYRFQHQDEVHGVAFSDDGRMCGTASNDAHAYVWDSISGRRLCEFTGHHRYGVSSILFVPGVDRCVTTGEWTARLWDAKTGQQIRQFEHPGVRCAAVSPDGRSLLTGAVAGAVARKDLLKAWDLTSGQLLQTFDGPDGDIERVAFSTDGHTALSSSLDGVIRVSNLKSGELIHAFQGDGGPPRHVAFAPRMRIALSGEADGTIKLWSLDAEPEAPVLRGHVGAVQCLAMSSEGLLALSGGMDGTVRLWDLATAREMRSFIARGAVTGVALSPDLRYGLSVGPQPDDLDAAILWDLCDGRRLGSIKFKDAASVAFGPDGKTAAVASGDVIKVLDVPSLKVRREFHAAITLARSLMFSSNGNLIVGCTTHGAAALWHIDSGLTLPNVFDLNAVGRVQEGQFGCSADLTTFAAGQGCDVVLWQPVAGRRLATLRGHTSWVNAIAMTPDGRIAASAGADRTVKLWDLARCAEVRTFRGAVSAARAVALSSDGSRLIVGSDDGSVQVWDLSRPQKYRDFSNAMHQPCTSLGEGVAGIQRMALLGEWYSLRGVDALAVQELTAACTGGTRISALALARSHWRRGDNELAAQAFTQALTQKEASAEYLRLCIRATANEREKK